MYIIFSNSNPVTDIDNEAKKNELVLKFAFTTLHIKSIIPRHMYETGTENNT